MGKLCRCLTAGLLFSVSFLCLAAYGQARFDLPGPKIDIRVTRSGVLLPIASVPNLQPGDQIWLHPDLPPTQSVHYLLIATFLRGTTNPPPDNWFIRIETWDKKVRQEGVTVTVPAEAQQAILFLAPETSGDFSTLRSAVKGRPGIFVRASQDLAEAGFEQGRIEKYLAAMKQVPPGDTKALQEHSDLLARTLALKPNPDCAKRPIDQQYTCLTQTGTQTLLDDGHAQSIASALSNGPGSDFINQASYTRLAGAGNYSAYVGAIVDLVRLTSGLHTAKYQYIPAIAFPAPQDSPQSLDLRLNTAPSFNNPKSVIVIGLPAVQKAVPPPLRPVDAKHVSCLLDPHLALPIEGAPLVFSTAFAHDLVLHIDTGSQQQKSEQDIPLAPDAYHGGLILQPNAPERRELPPVTPGVTQPAPNPGAEKHPSPSAEKPSTSGELVTGTVEGFWGFDRFTGPALELQRLPGSGWHILNAPATSSASGTLIVGKPNHLQLLSSGTACIQDISLQPSGGKIDWKLAPPPVPSSGAAAPEPVDVTLNLAHDTAPGAIHLAVRQFGEKDLDLVAATAFIEPASIEGLQLRANDTSATLTGTSLAQVKSLAVSVSGENITYLPQADSPGKFLTLTLPSGSKSPSFTPGEHLTAEVHLRDGRTVPVSALVLAARPSVTILSRRITQPAASPIELSSTAKKEPNLALGSQLVFFLKSATPFTRNEKIEIANQVSPDLATPTSDASDPAAASGDPDMSLHTILSVSAGSLVLQDAHTVLATFDPLKTFGPSTFGPFHLRPLASDGTPGEWVPLATIVRVPTLTSLTCPADPAVPCVLAGSSLYLIDSLSLDAAFTSPTRIPDGFVDASISLPHPAPAIQPAVFYLRLRDDPATVQQVNLPVQSDTPPPPRHGSKVQPPPAVSPAPPPSTVTPQ